MSKLENNMPSQGYLPRLVDGRIELLSQAIPGIEISGPKGCGKTTTSLRLAKSAFDLSDARKRALARCSPKTALEGQSPHLVDEWQEEPVTFDLARAQIDGNRGRPAQFILAGSAMAPPGSVKHCGAGRFGSVRMGTMTLAESGDSSRQVSFQNLLNGELSVTEVPELDIKRIAYLIVRGG